MRKSLKRLLDRLRAGSNGMVGKSSSLRAGLQEPQRIEARPAPARVRV